jgi:hypothetical protein
LSGSIASAPLIGFSPDATATIQVEVHGLNALFGTLTVSDGTFSSASLQRVVSLETDPLDDTHLRAGALISFIGVVKGSGSTAATETANFTLDYLSADQAELRVYAGANRLYGIFALKKR